MNEPQLWDSVQEAEAEVDNWISPIHSIRHIVPMNGKWAIKGHINCEHCEWCEHKTRMANTKHWCSIHDE